MAVFSYSSELEGKDLNIFSNSSELGEKNIHAYNEESAIYITDEDFGSITDSIDVEDDYGLIRDSEIIGPNYIDYGLITINETLVPYGPINVGDNDFADLKLVKVGIGDVTFSILGEAVIFTTPIEKGSGTLSIRGTAGDPRFTLSHYGSGSLFALDSATEVVGSNPPEQTILFRFSGFAPESKTSPFIGSGSLFTFVSATESSTNVETVKVLFKFAGESKDTFVGSEVGSGSLFTLDSATEVVGSNPPEQTALFKISGSLEESFTPATHVGSGSLFTFVSKTESTSSTESAAGLFRILGSAVPIISLSHVGSGRLFAFTGSSEAVTADPQESTALLKVVGVADYQFIKNNESIGSGTFTLRGIAQDSSVSVYDADVLINIEGSATESITPAPHIGSGRLFAFTGSSEAVTADPQESTALFRFAGQSAETATDSYVGSVNLDINGSATTIFELAHIGSGQIQLEGSASESITPAPHIGSGRLFAFTGSSESVTADPQETTALFKFAGSAVYRETSSYVGDVQIDLNGSATTIFNLLHVGSGSLFTFTSTTEAFVVNPQEETALFKFAGSVQESKTRPFIGSGSLFTFVGASESTSNAESSKGLFKFSGFAKDLFVLNNIGSGSLFAFTSTTEAFAVNPQEETALFRINGTARESQTRPFIGSGSLFTFVGATESSTNVETAQGLFKFAGESTNRFVANNIGSGSLFTFVSATESIAVNPQEETALFKITGSAVEKNTESYRGTGSLFTFVSATESVGSNPPESTAVFKFTGSATESITPAPHIGTGKLFAFGSAAETTAVSPETSGIFTFSGSVVQRKTNAFFGSGSLFGVSSTTEVFAVSAKTEIPLFRISGTVAESFVPAPHIGSGSLFSLSSGTESTLVSLRGSALFTFTGNLVETSTRSQLGSGSLFAITGSIESAQVVPRIAGVLFNLFGFVGESYTPAPEIGFGLMEIEGFSTDRKIEFVPAKPTRIIII